MLHKILISYIVRIWVVECLTEVIFLMNQKMNLPANVALKVSRCSQAL